MNTNDNKLWIEVREGDGGIEAKLCDLNIAARGENKEQMLRELAHSITVLHEVATETGETPFIRFINEVSVTEVLRRQSLRGAPFGSIELPHHVAVSLSTALRLANPMDRIALVLKEQKAA